MVLFSCFLGWLLAVLLSFFWDAFFCMRGFPAHYTIAIYSYRYNLLPQYIITVSRHSRSQLNRLLLLCLLELVHPILHDVESILKIVVSLAVLGISCLAQAHFFLEFLVLGCEPSQHVQAALCILQASLSRSVDLFALLLQIHGLLCSLNHLRVRLRSFLYQSIDCIQTLLDFDAFVEDEGNEEQSQKNGKCRRFHCIIYNSISHTSPT